MEKSKAPPSLSELETMKIEKQFEKFDEEIKSASLENLNVASKPAAESEPQLKMAQNEIANAATDTRNYLKPKRTLGCNEKFNEKFRADWEFDKEYVYFVAQHNEIIGESIQMWTKPYQGIPPQEWVIPTNRPIWAPRYVAEKIKGCTYRRLKMDENSPVDSGIGGTLTGRLTSDMTVQRLDAFPATTKKSVFMGATSF